MRSIRLIAATTVMVAMATACGDGGTDVGNPPVANFTAPSCTAGTACQFTDASTPATEITAWSWTFGDTPTPDPNQNPTHTYNAPGDYTVTLTVTSPEGTDTETKTVTVAAPANQPPVASFSAPSCGEGIECSFQSSSADPDGNIASTHWDFGDPTSPSNTADTEDASHRYAAAGTYNVTLTVTDDEGATGTTTQAITVLPVAASDCATTGTVVICDFDISQRSTVKLTLTSRDCELLGNRVTVTGPFARQEAFGNICGRPAPAEYTVMDGGAPAVFAAGSQLQIQFTQGTAGPTDPVPGNAVARVAGSFPNWTMTVDDGGNPDAQNEPDFNDVVLGVQATAAP